MRKRLFLILLIVLFLAGCGEEQRKEQNEEQTKELFEEQGIDKVTDQDINQGVMDETAAPIKAAKAYYDKTADRNEPVAADTEGKLHFDLSSARSILIKSTPESDGVTITEEEDVKAVSDMFSVFTPYNASEDYEPEYHYVLTFYDAGGMELTTVNACENFIISCKGAYYYDDLMQLYIWNIRKAYIDKVKTTFSMDMAAMSFQINGKKFEIRDLDMSINAVTDYSWFGSEELPEPSLVLECHINPQVGYCAVFDAEKMNFVFGAYGTNFTFENYSVVSLIYEFQNNVYNYWGDSIYQNSSKELYIYDLEYDPGADNAVIVTLSARQEEKLIEAVCINYHQTNELYPGFDPSNTNSCKTLAEFKADLTHDGENEVLDIYQTGDSGELTIMNITDAKGKVIRAEYAHTSHAGWNSVYLCRIKGEDYILIFNPYQCTGSAAYEFEVYDITAQDTLQVIDSGYLSFAYENKNGTFNEEKFRTFADRVNTYLQSGFLLISTEGGELRYSTDRNRLSDAEQYKTEKWLSEIKKSLY